MWKAELHKWSACETVALRRDERKGLRKCPIAQLWDNIVMVCPQVDRQGRIQQKGADRMDNTNPLTLASTNKGVEISTTEPLYFIPNTKDDPIATIDMPNAHTEA